MVFLRLSDCVEIKDKEHFFDFVTKANSFPGSLFFPSPGARGGGKRRDHGNEVGKRVLKLSTLISHRALTSESPESKC